MTLIMLIFAKLKKTKFFLKIFLQFTIYLSTQKSPKKRSYLSR